MSSISTRPATIEDAKFLLDLKNDPDVRKFSIVTTKKIKYKDHLRWLEEHLKYIEIIELGGIPVGDVRLEPFNGGREVAIKLLKDYRGQGVGKVVLGPLEGRLYAKVTDGNIPSMNLFYSSGFKATAHYRKERYWILLRTPF